MESNKEIKKSKNKNRVLIFLIVLSIMVFIILIPIIINELYKHDGYSTVWNGADVLLYYGAVLGALGTIALGVLALWQNHVLQKENEKVQSRLESISIHSNEVIIINKIVEYETTYLKRIDRYMDEFIEISLPIKDLGAINLLNSTNTNMKMAASFKEMESQYIKIITALTHSLFLAEKRKKLQEETDELYEQSCKVYSFFKKGDFKESAEDVGKMREMVDEFKVTKELYVMTGYENLKEILLGDYTLEQIREACKKLEDEDGQAEDAEQG